MNIGVAETLQNELRTCIDYLSFTIFSMDLVDDAIDWLGYNIDDFTQLPKGGMGYKSILQLNGYTLQILYDGKEDMGIHVNISGSSIEEVVRAHMETKKISTPFGNAYDMFTTGLVDFLKDVLAVGTITRLDLAVDDIGARFYKLDDIKKLLNNECDGMRIISKFRNWQEICKRKINGEKTGQTIYLGSRKSETFLRIYDKRLEQLHKSGGDVGIEWIRWELELKKDRAEQVANLIVQREELGTVFTGVLNNYMRVVNKDDSNSSRCTISSLWESFICTMEKLRLYISGAEKTLEEKISWFKSQVAPTLAGIIVSTHGDMGIIYDFFDVYLEHMSKDMRNICDRYNPTWRIDWGLDDECIA